MKKLLLVLLLFVSVVSFSQEPGTGDHYRNPKDTICMSYKQKRQLDNLRHFYVKIVRYCSSIAETYYDMDVDIDVRLKRIKFIKKEVRRWIKLYNNFSEQYNLTDRILSVYDLKRRYSVEDFDCYVGE